jgi:hypothetical protein
LAVTHLAGRRHLPIVELKKAAQLKVAGIGCGVTPRGGASRGQFLQAI